ncbi:HpcH/HpaI aldolase/citrate lyase family protein [Lacicoccus alkaliphilus]|uniref:Citrate lyase subunit beta / citryl-CoA lyase n=1 Tax=Lacicoccus alkaliphilus DSM 16010 TaxID=1123231 RepID=A0A1M7DYY3_9BACL|nr:CoA ester lyase [Salinicoccus alkaliphilus]SHL84715.1 citrate lyase subunit beta / citryl-CoA lyase [Salinicoccus alkaliphilus DSM 16010]
MDKSWFFIPGSKDKFLSKSTELSADIIIFDLEDSVVPTEKASAREKIMPWLNHPDIHSKKYIRVNEIHSTYFIDDLQALVSEHLDGVVLPKTGGADDIKILDYLLTTFEKQNDLKLNDIKIAPLIETGKGMMNALEIASASPRVEAMAFGAEDYMLDVSIPGDDDHALLHARSTLAAASSAAGISQPVDSVFTDFKDEAGLKEASAMSRGYGFQGRLVIHPKQIETVNEVYAPTHSEVEEAEKIVDAFEASIDDGDGAVAVEGKMIDPPVYERAKKLLKM